MGRKAGSDRDRAGLSRREFSRILVAGAASTALRPETTTATGNTKPGYISLGEQTPELSAEAQAQYSVLISKYGSRLSEEQKADVRRLIDQGLKSTATIRSFKLENTDEPANVFRARLTSER